MHKLQRKPGRMAIRATTAALRPRQIGVPTGLLRIFGRIDREVVHQVVAPAVCHYVAEFQQWVEKEQSKAQQILKDSGRSLATVKAQTIPWSETFAELRKIVREIELSGIKEEAVVAARCSGSALQLERAGFRGTTSRYSLISVPESVTSICAERIAAAARRKEQAMEAVSERIRRGREDKEHRVRRRKQQLEAEAEQRRKSTMNRIKEKSIKAAKNRESKLRQISSPPPIAKRLQDKSHDDSPIARRLRSRVVPQERPQAIKAAETKQCRRKVVPKKGTATRASAAAATPQPRIIEKNTENRNDRQIVLAVQRRSKKSARSMDLEQQRPNDAATQKDAHRCLSTITAVSAGWNKTSLSKLESEMEAHSTAEEVSSVETALLFRSRKSFLGDSTAASGRLTEPQPEFGKRSRIVEAQRCTLSLHRSAKDDPIVLCNVNATQKSSNDSSASTASTRSILDCTNFANQNVTVALPVNRRTISVIHRNVAGPEVKKRSGTTMKRSTFAIQKKTAVVPSAKQKQQEKSIDGDDLRVVSMDLKTSSDDNGTGSDNRKPAKRSAWEASRCRLTSTRFPCRSTTGQPNAPEFVRESISAGDQMSADDDEKIEDREATIIRSSNAKGKASEGGKQECTDYGIEDLSSNDPTDPDENPRKEIPKWAHEAELKEALRQQQLAWSSSDIDALFGKIHPPNVEQILGHKRRRPARRSSIFWESPIWNPRVGRSAYDAISQQRQQREEDRNQPNALRRSQRQTNWRSYAMFF